MSKRLKTLLIWVLLIVIFLAAWQLLQSPSHGLPSRSEAAFRAEVVAGNVVAVTPDHGRLVVTEADGSQYQTPARLTPPLRGELSAHDVNILAPAETEKDSSSLSTLLITILPLVFLVAVGVFFLRRMGGGQNIFTLRKTTARIAEIPKTTFADVGGAEEAKARLAEVVDFIRQPKRWEKAGARLPAGVLLEGPPGSGKTLLARAVAGEAKVPFFEVSASEFVELFVGIGAARVRDLFEQAAKKAPAIVFIDELDAVGRRRGAGASSVAHQEREQTLNQLLVNLDGFRKSSRIVVIAATNRADILDRALVRPGRFDVRLTLPPPPAAARAEILAIHTKGKPLGSSVDLADVARKTEGLSGAELEHLANEAALSALRRSKGADGQRIAIDGADFEGALSARSARRQRFDKLDVAIIESTSQLTQATGRVVLRATAMGGTTTEGELVWMDAQFIKLRTSKGGTAVIAKHAIVQLEPLEATEAADAAELVEDPWARANFDAA